MTAPSAEEKNWRFEKNGLGTRLYDPDQFEFPERVWLLLPGDEHPPTPELTTNEAGLSLFTDPDNPDLQRYNAREYVPAPTRSLSDLREWLKERKRLVDRADPRTPHTAGRRAGEQQVLSELLAYIDEEGKG